MTTHSSSEQPIAVYGAMAANFIIALSKFVAAAVTGSSAMLSPTAQGFGSQEPKRFILMTPLMVAVGGLVAFFSVVLMVVILPTSTYNPPPSDNWVPLSDQALNGRWLI